MNNKGQTTFSSRKFKENNTPVSPQITKSKNLFRKYTLFRKCNQDSTDNNQ